MHGPCFEYNRDGSLVEETNYQNGKKITTEDVNEQ